MKLHTYTIPTDRGVLYWTSMATLKQKNLAKGIIENMTGKPVKTAAELLVSVGYDETTATAMPHRTIAQKGVQEELKKLGFDEEKAKEVVGQIMLSEDEEAKDRLKAAEMVFKVFGSFAPEKRMNMNIQVKEPSERLQKLAKKLNS